ncbi:hypothetical protein E8E14_005777 [Neopestalotiopsis sp. 37M]|nr:hypothetical protein E8E14_005777 [Neopestalotiopsis sp. 37M]
MAVQQTLERRYVDRQKLAAFWRTHPDFRGQNCRITKDDALILELPREMTKDEIKLSDTVTDESMLEPTLRKHLSNKGEHFVSLIQNHSLAPFNASETALRKTFTALQIWPTFLDILLEFGEPSSTSDSEHSGGYDLIVEKASTTRSNLAFRLSYIFRYAARTGREDWPWSIRKMGIYHHLDGNGKSIWVLLQPNKVAQNLPLLTFEETAVPIDKHLQIFKHSQESWKAYLQYLESQVKSQSHHVRRVGSSTGRPLHTNNLQSLQYLSEKLHVAVSSLKASTEVLKGLKSLGLNIDHSATWQIDSGLVSYLSNFGTFQHWTHSMLERTKQTSNLATILLSSEQSRAVSINTSSLNTLAQSSKADGKIMLAIAQDAKNDSGVMKLLALVTLMYLPATFVATLFSTGFIAGPISNGVTDKAQITTQAVLYTVITSMLTAATIICSQQWLKRSGIQIRIF